MKQQLNLLRHDLEDNYFRFFELVAKRRKIVKKISQIKGELELDSWDFDREKKLFGQMQTELKSLSLKELLALSLLIEDHAQSTGNSYPEWSKAVHLDKACTAPSNLSFQINPVMLYFYDFPLFAKLPLLPEILTKIEGHFGQ